MRKIGGGSLTRWPVSVLTAARRIYQRAGFQLADSQRHHSFGHDLVGQHGRLAIS